MNSSCRAMSFRKPTPIQQACIPAILEGRNVMGCAETGSGKTAAFALPILQHLSEDPFGVFAVVLTPTRELAVQIEEQINALGSQIAVRTCLIIGGMGIIDQATALSKRPHIIIATPGRLRHHLESADGAHPPPPQSALCLSACTSLNFPFFLSAQLGEIPLPGTRRGRPPADARL